MSSERVGSSERRGDWFQTATGKQFWPLDPHPDEVCIEDIAHHLANQCRFAGACRAFYSVAQHSVLVSCAVPPEDQKWGLLHDAAEAYLQDLIRPIKAASALGEEYRKIEDIVLRAVCERFGLPVEEPHSVKVADVRVLLAEKRDLTLPAPAPWGFGQRAFEVEPVEEVIVPWSPREAHYRFFQRYAKLFDGKEYDQRVVWGTIARTRRFV